MMEPTQALILAAGAGTRLRGRKSRLLVTGQPLAWLHARRAREAGCTRVVVVVHPDDADFVSREAEVCVSTEADQSGSLARGAVALGADDDECVLLSPVDVLPARAATIATLRARFAPPFDAVTPEVGGVGGHPVLVRGRVLAPYAAGSAAPLRDVLRALGDRRLRVPVDDPNVVTDLDTPENVLAATGEPPAFFTAR